MSNFVDFAEVKASNPIEKVVEKLGLTMKKSGATLRGKCPVCESTNDRNLAVTPDKSVFYCFGDGKGGDQIGLVAHVLGLSTRDAAQYLAGAQTPKEKPKEEKSSEGFKPLTYLEHDHEAVTALGFDPTDAQKIGIGYCPRGILRGQVAVPVRLADGTLCGYLGVQDAVLPPSWKY